MKTLKDLLLEEETFMLNKKIEKSEKIILDLKNEIENLKKK